MAGAKRVLIIGIDGATFDLVKPWLEAGSLPNLQKIYEGGASCVLLSTLPSNSPPAWTSFMTGMNPGKHGLYGFTRVVPEQGYSRKINSGAVRKVPSVFQYLTTLGYRSAAINMPMLYPPDPINGVIVTGIDTPGTDSEFTYPHELRHKIFELIPNYILDVRSWGAFLTTEKRAHLFEDIINMIDHRKKLTLQLLSEETWDLFSVVFTATDRAQHFFWRYLDKNHPLYDPDEAAKYKDAIWLVHKKIDDAIGELLAYCDEDTTVAVMSDHGFGPQLRLFRLNQWMLENGFLSLANSNSNKMLPHFLHAIEKQLYYGLVNMVTFARTILTDTAKDRLKRMFPGIRERVSTMEALAMTDWSNTKAYHTAEFPGGIRINMKGREQNGIVEPGEEYDSVCTEIREGLLKVKNPETGEPVVKHVYRRDELYWGPYMEMAPDLIIDMADYSYTIDWRIPVSENSSHKNSHVIDKLSGDYTTNCGYHRPEGILMLYGKNIRKNVQLEPANIYDVIPTALYLADVPIPEDMDGKVLTEAIKPEVIEQKPIEYSDPLVKNGELADEDVYSEEESEVVAERLKDLGYL